jgi:hypothetical protein
MATKPRADRSRIRPLFGSASKARVTGPKPNGHVTGESGPGRDTSWGSRASI